MAHRPFIGSSYVGPAQGAITLRGDIDADAADQFAGHLDAFLDAAIRAIAVDTNGLHSCDLRVLDLLGRTQCRLDDRGGLITVTGLHPSTLPAPTSPALVQIGEVIRTPRQR